MSLSPAALFLTSLGQALSTRSLYSDGHPMHAASRDRVHAALVRILDDRGALRISFLDDAVIVGARALADMRVWEWAPRLAAVGVQRLEVDAVPSPTPEVVERLIDELHQRLASGSADDGAVAVRSFRFGPVGVETDLDANGAVGDLLGALTQLPMTEEASAVRWIHDAIASGGAVPMAEVEAVVHSLGMAIQGDEHTLLPLLDITSHDQYTTTHACNVAMLSMALAEQVGMSAKDRRAIGTAALLHDIGKVRVPAEILVKPGALSAAEMTIMRSHAAEGARILSGSTRGHALAATVAYEHHIWEDGTGGYPARQWSGHCHFASRLVHVCDLYDALSSRRPYREAWPKARILAMLQERSGVEVDGEMVRAFIAMISDAVETRSAADDLEEATGGWSGEVAAVARQLLASEPDPSGVPGNARNMVEAT